MSDDLVKRLRKEEDSLYGTHPCGLLDDAADRIEALQKALRFYAEYTPVFSQQDFRAVARAALEGQDD